MADDSFVQRWLKDLQRWRSPCYESAIPICRNLMSLSHLISATFTYLDFDNPFMLRKPFNDKLYSAVCVQQNLKSRFFGGVMEINHCDLNTLKLIIKKVKFEKFSSVADVYSLFFFSFLLDVCNKTTLAKCFKYKTNNPKEPLGKNITNYFKTLN